jgi:hypothetical protein
MTDATLRQALAYARRGWPVFPCLPGQKIPATTHGYKNHRNRYLSSWSRTGWGHGLDDGRGAGSLAGHAW